VKRYYLQAQTNTDGTTSYVRDNSNNNVSDDALGGKVYYLARAEIEIPLGSGAREMGLRPSIFMDAGAVAGLKNPGTIDFAGYCTVTTGTTSTSVRAPSVGNCSTPPAGSTATYAGGAFEEEYLGDTLKPRLSVGFGVNWNSPFGPFRIDIAKALLKEPGDDNKLITFNVGTQF
jgi:outer membrane protein insertion porin family